MTRSPDEIKKAMLHCSPVSCRSNDCPYRDDAPKYEGDMPVCRMKLWNDMGRLIQQLEAERDAAVRDLTEMAQDTDESCEYCEMFKTTHCSLKCRMKNKGFKWRGVQKEE